MQENLLLVEGKDEDMFFSALFKHLGIARCKIKSVEGKTNFTTTGNDAIRALLKSSEAEPDGEFVPAIGILCDSDGNPRGAFDSRLTALTKLQKEMPALQLPSEPNQWAGGKPNLGIFIIENELEDICLTATMFPDVLPCVEAFIECLPKERRAAIKKMSKAKVNAYLAAMPKDTEETGLAAQKGYWNFDTKSLKDLKNFLENFR
jgi:hypothetical protein